MFIYPDNLKAKPMLWLWLLRDIAVIGIGALLSVLALAQGLGISYPLNAAEQDVLLRKMEEYCQKQTGMSLCDYSRQLREEQEQEQGFEPKMKM